MIQPIEKQFPDLDEKKVKILQAVELAKPADIVALRLQRDCLLLDQCSWFGFMEMRHAKWRQERERLQQQIRDMGYEPITRMEW